MVGLAEDRALEDQAADQDLAGRADRRSSRDPMDFDSGFRERSTGLVLSPTHDERKPFG